ncbi:MAG: MFS transporter, partial [Firmicutes bacterium]|nr:MFS transporter [Bacillota bacterium]
MSEDETRFPVRILVATFLPHLSVSFALGSIGPLAPFIQEAFHITRAQIGILTSFHSIGWIVMALVAGSLVERTGTRPWLLLSPLISGICALLFSMITTFSQGIVIFLFMGLIFSFINPATTKAIILSFSRVRRGTAIAIKQTGGTAGVFLASISLPAIAVSAGWGRGMLLVAAVNVVLGISAWTIYGNRGGGQQEAENGTANTGSFKRSLGRLLHNSDFLLISFLQGIFN